MSSESVASVHADKSTVVLTVLCDNRAARAGVVPVHGLSVLVETPDRRVLFDTGADGRTVYNADVLGISLAGLDAVVLSHGHYDHVGGLEAVLERTGAVTVYAHAETFRRAYARDDTGKYRYIGPPRTVEDYERLGARFQWVEQPVALGEYMLVFGGIPLHDRSVVIHSCLLRECRAHLVEDSFRDEIAMVVTVGDLCLTVTGCAHAGVANTVRVSREFVVDPHHRVLLGGFHLEPYVEGEIREMALRVHALGVRTLLPCHCTGARGIALLQDTFLGQVTPIATGSVIEAGTERGMTVHHPAS